MFKNVLVGVDGRQGGRDAVALAARLADAGAKLTLAHVYSGPLRPSHAVLAGLLDDGREASQKLLNEELSATGVTAELISVMSMSPG
ncbi:MAG: universal stress protein, partial [Acidobacteriota bacterium]|nr:universal stress protein [Acidobacteriota bacterium]